MSFSVRERDAVAMFVYSDEETKNAAKRNANPVGAIVHLIGHFVQRFVEDERIEQPAALLMVRRQEDAAFGCAEIGVQICGADVLIPRVGGVLENVCLGSAL